MFMGTMTMMVGDQKYNMDNDTLDLTNNTTARITEHHSSIGMPLCFSITCTSF